MMNEVAAEKPEIIADEDVMYYLALPRVERPFHIKEGEVMRDKPIRKIGSVYAIGNSGIYKLIEIADDYLIGIKPEPKEQKTVEKWFDSNATGSKDHK